MRGYGCCRRRRSCEPLLVRTEDEPPGCIDALFTTDLWRCTLYYTCLARTCSDFCAMWTGAQSIHSEPPIRIEPVRCSCVLGILMLRILLYFYAHDDVTHEHLLSGRTFQLSDDRGRGAVQRDSRISKGRTVYEVRRCFLVSSGHQQLMFSCRGQRGFCACTGRCRGPAALT